MSELEELKEQVALLRAEVSALRRDAGIGRLGPGPETAEEEAERTRKLREKLESAVRAEKHQSQREAEERERLASIPPVDRSKLCTTDGRSPAEARASQTNETGQHESYIVLCEEERKKGFVRPYRDSYKHVGRLVEGEIIDGGVTDRPPRRVGGCGTVTRMGRALSETYARDPKFYSHTFCVHCNNHPPVAEFVWTSDGQQVGS